MTAWSFKERIALVAFVLAISVGAGVSRAEYDPSKMSQPQNPPADKSKQDNVKVDKKEESAYKEFYTAQGSGPATQIQLGEAFVAKFPNSRYLSGVYATLTTAYYSTGQVDKMLAAGAKSLELDPDNADVLSLLAMAIPRRLNASAPDAAQQLQKAEAYGRHAIEVIPTLTKPPKMDDASFEKAKNDKLSLAHSGLGLIDIDHSKFEDARTELMQAVQLSSTPDPVNYYLLGNADSQASYFNDAAAAFEKCAASGPLMPQCKAKEDAAKQDATTKLGR